MAAPVDKQPIGSLTDDAGDPSFTRGAAGSQAGAPDTANTREPHGDLEERRETQHVLRPSTDGVGEGLPKDQG